MADATDILNAVAGVITALAPTVPVRISKRRAADGRNMESGYQSGFPLPCYVLSCNDAEDIDRVSASFLYLTVGYAVTVEYVKAAQQAITNAPNDGATTVVEDPDVRNVRAALRAALFKAALPGVPVVFHVRYAPRGVYEKQSDTGAVVLVSGQTFTYFTTEPRPHP